MTEPAGSTAAPATAGRWVLDPSGSQVDFYTKTFWGLATVHGRFEQLTGEGTVESDGTAAGTLTIDAASLNTKNKQRDNHLRSADFFDAVRHPALVLTLTAAKPAGPATLACTGTLEAAGNVRPVDFTADITEADAAAVVLRAELTVDRTGFGMTWNRMGMVGNTARGTVVARFVRP